MTVQELIDLLRDARYDPKAEVKIGCMDRYENELQTEPFAIVEKFDESGVVVLGGAAWAKVRMANRKAEVTHTNPY